MKLGIIGLGKMGANLALQAIDKKILVVGKARSRKSELEQKGITIVDNYAYYANFRIFF